ncbi:DUF397 domain-containing protein [Phytohabitans kaempferiae]|uniref:DUF397 domain-containing protein n=1 Tax=Phytohabitans kaempferiae TaxID=1620943 RepID=A0ABV6M6Z8_9ACTN
MYDLSSAVWRKSSQSMNGDCVEFAPLAEVVGVRDSKDPTGPVLVFTRSQWRAFVDGAKDGDFGSR